LELHLAEQTNCIPHIMESEVPNMDHTSPSPAKRKTLDSAQDPFPSPQLLAKRQKVEDSDPDDVAKSDRAPSIKSAHSSASHESGSEEPPPLSLIKQSNKVIWIDIGINPEETYWWPGLVFEKNLKSYVALMPNSKCELIDVNPKLLDSVKASMPFKAHSAFDPVRLNPILRTKELASKYPTKKSLEKTYLIAREKHVVYSFQEDDDLPDLSACMIPLSQESRAALANVVSFEEKCRRASPERDELYDILNQPDHELEIPGETILCRAGTNNREFWPARVISYVGLKSSQRRGLSKSASTKTDKIYRVQFCDGRSADTPRSSFWTTDQEEFYQVKIGQLKTQEVKFADMIPDIEKQLHHIDLIVSGKSSDPNLVSKHENFLTSLKNRGSIPKDVKYGKYSEELIHKVGDFLRDRYLVNQPATEEEDKITVDSRFEKLTETEKSQYIFDILVPELIWLITVAQYLEDGRDKLVQESGLSWEELEKDPSKKIPAEKILEEAKKLAALDIHEVDLVDKVISLRGQRGKPSHSPEAESEAETEATTAATAEQSPSVADALPTARLRRNTSSSKLFPIKCKKPPSSTTPKLRQTSNSRKACTS